MRKFTQPVSMQVTKEQYERDLKEPLRALGYNPESSMSPKGNGLETLATNFYEKDSDIGYIFDSCANNYGRHFIKSYNPDLFLALAAISEGDYQVGEYVIADCGSIKDYIVQLSSIYPSIKGKFYTPDVRNYSDINGGFSKIERRCTKEELIELLDKNKQSMNKQAVPFAIYGKSHQLEAINKDLEEIGFQISEGKGEHLGNSFDQTGYKALDTFKQLGYYRGAEGTGVKRFELPKDYQAALDHASAQLELFKPKDIVINGYTAEIKDNHVNFGCKTITKEQLLAIKEVSKLTRELGGVSIIQGTVKGLGTEFTDLITLEVIDQLLEKLK